jgi:lipid-A-disaccharide synthase
MSRHDAAPGRPAIMVAAGEASGDLHAAALCRALTAAWPELRLFGLGGPAMRAAGFEALGDISETAVVGVTEVVRRLPALRRLFRRLADCLTSQRPAALVLVDFPGFNLRLAREARRAGVPVVYFVPPQVWAWGRGRLGRIREVVTRVLAIFPFEAAMYREAGVPVEFVGHPALDAIESAPSRAAAREALGLAPGELVIGLLPGSRPREIERMTPLFGEASASLAARHPRARFLVALAPGIAPEMVRARLPAHPAMTLVERRTHAVMRAADLLLVTSGTATLETGLLGTPMVVAYRLSWLSDRVSRSVVKIPWANLVNVVLGRAVVPEFCLRAVATADRVAAAALALLESPDAMQAQREAFVELRDALGDPGVAERAAHHVLAVAGLLAPGSPVLTAAARPHS